MSESRVVKECKTCGVSKDENNFSLDRNAKRRCSCKACEQVKANKRLTDEQQERQLRFSFMGKRVHELELAIQALNEWS